MMSPWLTSLLLVLALAGFGSSIEYPKPCPNLGSTQCYNNDTLAILRPAGNLEYFALGGLFNLRTRSSNGFECGTDWNPTGVLQAQAFLWAVNYYRANQNNNQVSIGAVVFDSCERTDQMIGNILGFEQCTNRISGIDRHNLVGFVGPVSNTDSMAAARLTGEMGLPVISPSADSAALSDSAMYPYFLRTAPHADLDIDIMATVLNKVNAKYVAAIYQQSEMETFEVFGNKMKAMNVCISANYSMTGAENDSIIDSFIVRSLIPLSDVRYVALFVTPTFLAKFVDRVNANNDARTADFIFLITSDIRKDDAIFSSGANAVALRNAIVLEQQEPSSLSADLANFKTFWNNIKTTSTPDSYLARYLSTANPLPAYDVNVARTIMATKALMDAVQQVGQSLCGNSNSNSNYLCSNFFSIDSRGPQINQRLRNIGIFSANGDLMPSMAAFNVLQYDHNTTSTFKTLGTYAGNSYTEIMDISSLTDYRAGRCQETPCLPCGELPPVVTTTTAATTTLVPVCRSPYEGNYSLVYYPPNQEITGAYMSTTREDSDFATRFEIGRRWIIALGVLAGLGILAVLIFEIYILYKLLGTQMGQKWRTMWLGQLLLLGIFLCYLTLFAYLPIPTKATCGITRFGVGVSYSICFAVLLVKLMVILTSKSSENSLIPGDAESPNYLKGIYQFLMFVFVVGVQVVIDAQWLITVPPEAVQVTSNSGAKVWVCNHYTFSATGSPDAMTMMSGFVRNEFENHILSLVYIMFLILITTLLALNAHGIITNHRESVFIGIAAGFSIPIWLAWTLVGGLNRDDDYAHEFGDACIAFGLFITATLILFSMFLPKVRQLVNMGVEGIYFEDDRETYYAGSVIMAPPSYKSRPNSRPNSVIYVNNQGIYSEPVVLGNGDSQSNYMRHPAPQPTPSTYSAPPRFIKSGDSTIRGGSVLRITDDLSGKRPMDNKKRAQSEVAYGTTSSRPRSVRGTLPRSRSITNLGAL